MAFAAAVPTTPDDDSELMRRVQTGDEAALGTLMQRWELPLKALIARLVLNTSEGEELAQETFVRVWQQRARFRENGRFRPWVFSIAINLARNRLRWWRRRPTVSLQEWETPDGSGREMLATDSEKTNSANALERAEQSAAVREAIAALPVDLREAIVLFEYEQLSQAEIAVAVGATPKAVETRIYRAREKLRAALQRWS